VITILILEQAEAKYAKLYYVDYGDDWFTCRVENP
jgi:hypothetical protein